MPEHWCACGEDINGHEWQAAAKRHLDLATEYRLRAEQAEATIQRVREFLADKDEGLTDEARAQGHFILVDTDSVRRALEGDNDD